MRPDVFYAIFSSVTLPLSTSWISMQALFGEQMWVLDSNYPSGLDAFWVTNLSNWYMDLAVVSLTLLQLTADGLMVRDNVLEVVSIYPRWRF